MKDPHALVALVLAVGVAGAVVVLAVFILRSPHAITEAEATLLATVLGAAVGAIATYLGGGNRKGPT